MIEAHTISNFNRPVQGRSTVSRSPSSASSNMSSSNPGYAPMEKKKKGFSKYVTKMKNVFKDSQHKRKSDIPPVAVPGIAGEAGGITADEQE